MRVTGGQSAAEEVARLCAEGHPGAVLGEDLAAGAGKAAGRPVQDVHGARVTDEADILAGDADRQSSEAVVVEVAARQRHTEAVAWLGAAAYARGVLGEDLAAGAGEFAGRPVQHVHRATITDEADILAGDADRQISEAVVGEVAARQREPEEVAGLCAAAHARGALGEDLPAG